MKIRDALGILITLSMIYPTFGQSDNLDKLGRPAWMSSPKPALPPGLDTVSTAIRSIRSHHFDSAPGQAALIGDITDPSRDGVGSGAFYDRSLPSGIPASTSDVIAMGTAVAFQPFLSNDHTHIYSELAFKPSQYLKESKPAPGQTSDLTIMQSGGSLKLADNRTIVSPPYGGTYPLRLAVPYLLFLKYDPPSKAYSVVAAWDISKSRPIELDGDGHPYIDADPSLRNNTDTIASLVSLVQSRLPR